MPRDSARIKSTVSSRALSSPRSGHVGSEPLNSSQPTLPSQQHLGMVKKHSASFTSLHGKTARHSGTCQVGPDMPLTVLHCSPYSSSFFSTDTKGPSLIQFSNKATSPSHHLYNSLVGSQVNPLNDSQELGTQMGMFCCSFRFHFRSEFATSLVVVGFFSYAMLRLRPLVKGGCLSAWMDS
ncbi:hypothetical protein CEXT_774241 [Caerostris extrusa]|uniref:Uncharacterized protein n=1 Tax=Caerostris extrusa TaxID=172846 RepID=A0AAV4V4F5_CAEEX|nr:hypothetical protein CEXT_774241 [Caerostris extrusa]